MNTLIFRERANRGRRVLNWFLAMACIFVVAPDVFDYWNTGTADWYSLFFIPMNVLLWFSLDSGGEKGPSTLKLDDRGLTYGYRLIVRRWSWAELPAPDIQHPDDPTGRYMPLHPKQPIDWRARAAVPAVKARGWELRIHDIFDTPLAEIREKLIEYRDRAIGTAETQRN